MKSKSLWKIQEMTCSWLVEEHKQKQITKEFTELYYVSQKDVVDESLLEEEEVTAKQSSSGAIKETLKAWEIAALCIEKHHPNKSETMRATNLFNDNAVSHFRQFLKCQKKQMSLDCFLVKKN
ncbi:hypothetical protein AVEN_241213-1 [Araneus ventricosus]|uniref:Uncharacterized protein n=1 Tax=Araneus ventricosus TaxID=182803 RepID=A0A4Y2D1Q4_ARAVE|nr:hypothetical protein AVEN_241213-1 [Araneus ventricosus]